VTWLTIGCDRPERRATGEHSPSLAKVTCTGSLTIGQKSFSVSVLRYVHGMGAWANKSVQAVRVRRAARSALQPSCVRSRRTCGQGGGRGRTGCGRSSRASGGGAPCVGGLFVPATRGGRPTRVTPANPRRRAATRRRRPLLPPSVARSGCVRHRLRAAATLRGGGCGRRRLWAAAAVGGRCSLRGERWVTAGGDPA